MRPPIHPALGWILLSLTHTSSALAEDEPVEQPLRIGESWDAEVQVAFALAGIDSVPRRFFVRARAGMLSAYEPFFFMAGATFEGGGPVGAAGGLELSMTHLWAGVFADLGLAVNEEADTFIHVAVGWSIFGFEWHRRLTGDPSPLDDRDVYSVKLRLPIGLFFFAY
jgi:hypothetical protein